MDSHEPQSRRSSRLRERHSARANRKPGGMAAPHSPVKVPRVTLPPTANAWVGRGKLILQDAFWYLTHTRTLFLGVVGVALVVFLLFLASYVFSGRIFPNVWAMGVNLGDMTVEDATAALQTAWDQTTQIDLIDQDRVWRVSPADLGLQLDAQKTAEAARGAGLTGVPFGTSVMPVVSLDYTTAQTFLLNMTTYTDIPPYNAGYAWQDGQVTGVPGHPGRLLDVALMMDRLEQNTASIVANHRIDLLMSSLNPTVDDPSAFMAEAQTFITQPLEISGYDPFKDEHVAWSAGPDVRASWLEAGLSGLTLRDTTFDAFIAAQNQSLNPPGETVRYLDPVETKEKMRAAIDTLTPRVQLRVRYSPSTYEVTRGDTAFRISRKTGIPFFLIEEANAGRNLDQLFVGDVLNLPSRDVALPIDPVAEKRIVVDLRTQTLKAFDNGQLVYTWLISSGISDAPTSPGIYQILNHVDVSYGSSYTLCGSQGCSQWEMEWFMGMYEVSPGLMNGFHGAVILPNGTYLGGGNVGSPYTFGCVMSNAQDGKTLYEWATDGTVVEIISDEFAPESALAQAAFGGSSS